MLMAVARNGGGGGLLGCVPSGARFRWLASAAGKSRRRPGRRRGTCGCVDTADLGRAWWSRRRRCWRRMWHSAQLCPPGVCGERRGAPLRRTSAPRGPPRKFWMSWQLPQALAESDRRTVELARIGDVVRRAGNRIGEGPEEGAVRGQRERIVVCSADRRDRVAEVTGHPLLRRREAVEVRPVGPPLADGHRRVAVHAEGAAEGVVGLALSGAGSWRGTRDRRWRRRACSPTSPGTAPGGTSGR